MFMVGGKHGGGVHAGMSAGKKMSVLNLKFPMQNVNFRDNTVGDLLVNTG